MAFEPITNKSKILFYQVVVTEYKPDAFNGYGFTDEYSAGYFLDKYSAEKYASIIKHDLYNKLDKLKALIAAEGEVYIYEEDEEDIYDVIVVPHYEPTFFLSVDDAKPTDDLEYVMSQFEGID